MGLRDWLLWIVQGNPSTGGSRTLPRAVRRAAGRRRHRETGGPAWMSRDRDHRPRVRHVSDTGGLGMGYAGRRAVVVDDEEDEDRR